MFFFSLSFMLLHQISLQQLIMVKYRSYASSDLFDFQITVVDELSALNPTHVVDDAEIMLRNDLLGYDDKRQTKPDGN